MPTPKGHKRAIKVAKRISKRLRHAREDRKKRTPEVMDGLADDLATQVEGLPEAHKIVFLGYQGDRFIIATQDGSEVANAPKHWKGLPVEYREALPEEREAHREWIRRREDEV